MLGPIQPLGGDASLVDQPVLHGSFAVSRTLLAPPAKVFSSFAELPARRRWFRLPGKRETADHALDFRIGGGEIARSAFAAAGVREHLEYRSRFLDIVIDKRIVYTYEFVLDGRRRWVSLATIELAPEANRTRLKWTEQYAYLALTGDGRQDVRHLEGGTRLLLNALASALGGRR